MSLDHDAVQIIMNLTDFLFSVTSMKSVLILGEIHARCSQHTVTCSILLLFRTELTFFMKVRTVCFWSVLLQTACGGSYDLILLHTKTFNFMLLDFGGVMIYVAFLGRMV